MCASTGSERVCKYGLITLPCRDTHTHKGSCTPDCNKFLLKYFALDFHFSHLQRQELVLPHSQGSKLSLQLERRLRAGGGGVWIIRSLVCLHSNDLNSSFEQRLPASPPVVQTIILTPSTPPQPPVGTPQLQSTDLQSGPHIIYRPVGTSCRSARRLQLHPWPRNCENGGKQEDATMTT